METESAFKPNSFYSKLLNKDKNVYEEAVGFKPVKFILSQKTVR